MRLDDVMLFNDDKGLSMKKGLITIKEAAELFGVHPSTLRRWDKIGKLKATRHPMSNYRLYRIIDVEKITEKI